MTTLAGVFLDFPVVYDWPGDARLDVIEIAQTPSQYWGPEMLGAGPLSDEQPIREPSVAQVGARPLWPSDELWHRIWVVPSPLALGDLISRREIAIEVWNAHLTSKLHETISISGDDGGLTLLEAVARPRTWRPTEYHVHTLVVETFGPTTIAVDYRFDFTDDSGLLEVTGRRVVPWGGLVNWRDPVRERLEWLTDVISAWDGSEQRIRLRQVPRQEWEFLVTAAGDERRSLRGAMSGWQEKLWALPLWPYGTRLSADAPLGSLVLACDTTERGFTTGGLAMLWSASTSETVEVLAVDAGAITLAYALGNAWPAGTRVFPARRARLQAVQPGRSLVPEVSEWTLRWRVEDAADGWSGAEGADTYRGAPVLMERPNWGQGVDNELARALEELDSLTGPRALVDRTGFARERTTLRYTRSGRAAIAALRRLIYARTGRLQRLWVPSFESDLRLTATHLVSDGVLQVANVGYARFLVDRPGRRDLQITLTDGSRIYTRIASATEIDAQREQIAPETPLGVEITPAQVRRISYLRLARLTTDAVELAYPVPELLQAELSFEGDLDEL